MSTLTLTTTLASGYWREVSLSFDFDKIRVYAAPYGRVAVSEVSSIEVSGAALTVAFTLSRTVYSGEVAGLELDAGWVVDGIGNSGISNALDTAEMPTITNSSVETVPATTAAVSKGRLAWDLSEARPLSLDVLGFPCVDVSAGGVIITAAYPGQQPTSDAGKTRNTLWKSPSVGGPHAWDTRTAAGYDDALDVIDALPLEMAAGDAAMATLGQYDWRYSLDHPAGGSSVPHGPRLLEATPIYFMDGAADSAKLPAPMILPSSGATRLGQIALPDTLTNIAAALPSYTKPVGSPAMSDVLFYLSRNNPALYQSTVVEPRRQSGVRNFTRRDNYGLLVEQVTSAAVIALVLDYTTAEKEDLALWVMHHAYQLHGGWGQDGSSTMNADGGQSQGLVALGCMGLGMLGFTLAEMDTFAQRIGGNEVKQPFIWDTAGIAKLAPHSGLSGDDGRKFGLYLRRQPTLVDGTTLYFPDGTALFPSEIEGTILTRESDGATALVSDAYSTITAGTVTRVVVDAQPGSPFTTVDADLYFATPYTISEGDADWDIVGNGRWSPMPGTRYRSLNALSGMMALKAAGFLPTSLEAAYAYMKRTADGDAPSGYAFPDTFQSFQKPDGGSFSLAANVWADHGAAIDAL